MIHTLSVNVKTKAKKQEAAQWCIKAKTLAPTRHQFSLKTAHQAADQGDAAMAFNLGFNYAVGQGVKKDEATAVKWYLMAADQGPVQLHFRPHVSNKPQP